MEILVLLAVIPVCGVLGGWLAARLFPSSGLGAALFIVPFVPAAFQAANMALEARRYTGECSGWRERGSHPCTLWEFVTQEWELGLILMSIPLLIGIVIAFAVRAHVRGA